MGSWNPELANWFSVCGITSSVVVGENRSNDACTNTKASAGRLQICLV